MKPPTKLDGARVLHWAWSEEPFGVVASEGETLAISIHGLAICRYDDSLKVHRLSCNRLWESVQDSDYQSVEQAIDELPDQYRCVPARWVNAD